MGTNLVVTIPSRHPGAEAASCLAGVVAVVAWAIGYGGALAIHTALGLWLALFAVATAVRAARGVPAWLAGLGAPTVLGAEFNGARFLVFDHDQSSLVMALLFAVALAGYVVCLSRLEAA